jgi:hypothetical protein
MLVTPADSKNLDGVQKLIKTEIAFADIPGLPTERVPDEYADREGRSGRALERPRRDRDRGPKRERPIAPKPEGFEYAKMEPLTVVALPDADADLVQADPVDLEFPSSPPERGARRERSARPDRGPRGERGDSRSDRAPDPQPRRDDSRGERRDERRDRYDRRDRRERGEPVVIAFGGDTPAFMLRKPFQDA